VDDATAARTSELGQSGRFASIESASAQDQYSILLCHLRGAKLVLHRPIPKTAAECDSTRECRFKPHGGRVGVFSIRY